MRITLHIPIGEYGTLATLAALANMPIDKYVADRSYSQREINHSPKHTPTMNKFATEEYAELRERARRDGRGTSWEANGALLRLVEEKLQGFCKAASFGTGEDDGDGLAVLGLDNFEVTFWLCVKFKTEAGRTYKGLEGLGVGGVHRFIITAEVAHGKLKCYWVTNAEDRRYRISIGRSSVRF